MNMNMDLPCFMSPEKSSSIWKVFDSCHKFYDMDFPEHEVGDEICFSNYGWLLMRPHAGGPLYFLNPVTKEKQQLPLVTRAFQSTCCCFTAPPTSSNCCVFGIVGNTNCETQFGLFKLKDNEWDTSLLNNCTYRFWPSYCPPFFHNGVYYLLDWKHTNIMTFDPSREYECRWLLLRDYYYEEDGEEDYDYDYGYYYDYDYDYKDEDEDKDGGEDKNEEENDQHVSPRWLQFVRDYIDCGEDENEEENDHHIDCGEDENEEENDHHIDCGEDENEEENNHHIDCGEDENEEENDQRIDSGEDENEEENDHHKSSRGLKFIRDFINCGEDENERKSQWLALCDYYKSKVEKADDYYNIKVKKANESKRCFMVQVEGEIWGVFAGDRSNQLSVEKLDVSEGRWNKVESLGNKCLYVSSKGCFAETCGDDSDRANKIYFQRYHEIYLSIYHSLDTNSVQRIHNLSNSSGAWVITT